MGLDIEQPGQLEKYLKDGGHIAQHESIRKTVLRGGVSNRAVLVEHSHGNWVLKQALRKLRVEVEWLSDPARVHREAAGIRHLNEMLPSGSVPGFVFEDHAQHILAMEAVPQPHRNWKQMLLGGELVPDHIVQFAGMLSSIHQQSQAQAERFSQEFSDRSFFESLRLEPYYAYTATQVSDAAAFLHHLIEETRAIRCALVHGDYSPKNVLIHHDRLVLLDHEVIHWGDSAFDIGFSMTHLLSKAHHLTKMRTAFLDAALKFWRIYSAQTANDSEFESRAVRHLAACMLARAAGRSALEYLSKDARERQVEAVMSVLNSTADSIGEFVDAFGTSISARK